MPQHDPRCLSLLHVPLCTCAYPHITLHTPAHTFVPLHTPCTPVHAFVNRTCCHAPGVLSHEADAVRPELGEHLGGPIRLEDGAGRADGGGRISFSGGRAPPASATALQSPAALLSPPFYLPL